jgi:hypothetical protein
MTEQPIKHLPGISDWYCERCGAWMGLKDGTEAEYYKRFVENPVFLCMSCMRKAVKKENEK